MKKAIAYIRISDKDQSNFSIAGQTDMITTYCHRQQYHLDTAFIDDGKSAKNFDRPDWKKLETFIKKNHASVDYLVVTKYDRFSRNTAEALQMIELIEKKYTIRIISVMEPIHVHPDSPFFFQIRAQILVGAQVEWLIIRDRTRFGNHYAAKAGRYINVAPFGYTNARDEKNKPILVLNEGKAPVIRRMFEMLLQGAPLKEIYLEARRNGYKNRGHSAVKSTLQNPTYAGLIKVPAYNDEPAHLTKGLHTAIIDQATWYRAQDILQPKPITRTIMNEAVPLRGLLKCSCGQPFTAGNSKGRHRYYWYYKCNQHKKINYRADALHAQLEEVIKELSLPPAHIYYLKQLITTKLEQESQQYSELATSKKRELATLQHKIDRVEEKYLDDELDKEAYKKWKARYQEELALVQRQLVTISTPADELWRQYDQHLPRLNDLHYLYQKASLHEQQAMIRMWFNSTLSYYEGIYRTAYLMPLFAPKAASLKEKRLLIIEQPLEKSPENRACAPHRSTVEPLLDFISLIAKIKIA